MYFKYTTRDQNNDIKGSINKFHRLMDYQLVVQWLDSAKQRINWGTPVIPLVEFAEVRQGGYPRALRGYDVQNRHRWSRNLGSRNSNGPSPCRSYFELTSRLRTHGYIRWPLLERTTRWNMGKDSHISWQILVVSGHYDLESNYRPLHESVQTNVSSSLHLLKFSQRINFVFLFD